MFKVQIEQIFYKKINFFLNYLIIFSLILINNFDKHKSDLTSINHRSIYCNREIPGVTSRRIQGDNGFKIKISGNPEKYTPGELYTGKFYF
jgi:hypothetical protein